MKPRHMKKILKSILLPVFLGLTVSGCFTHATTTCSTPHASPMQEDFRVRIAATSSMRSFTKRDAVLASIAADAARADDCEATRLATRRITSFVSRDEAIGTCARILAKAGHRAEALELAKGVTSFTSRDALIGELAK